VLVWVWFADVTPGFRVAVSVLYAAFLLMAAPVWCGATTRDGDSCRNNSVGLIIGCHLRQHRWQKARAMLTPRKSREFLARLAQSPQTVIAAVGALAAVVSATAAWAQVLMA